MISMVKLLIKAQCGELAFLCCLTREQLGILASWTQDMTTDDLDLLYRVACQCSVSPNPNPNPNPTPQPQPPPPPPPPPQGNETESAMGLACGQALITAMCTPPASTVMLTLKEAVDLALLTDPDPATKTLLFVLAIAFETMEAACLEQDIAIDSVVGLCKVVNFLGGVAQGMLPDAVLQFWQSGPVIDAIKACCSDPTIQSADAPDWTESAGI